MQVEGLAAAFDARVVAAGLLLPGELVVAQGVGECFVDDALLERLVIYRESDFHAPEEIAVHPVGRRQVHRLFALGIEIEDAGVLQEAAHDGAHADVLRQARHPGAQGAHAAHDQVDLHARLAGLVELGDDLLFEQRIHLGHDARPLARLGGARLGADQRHHALVQGERRLHQRLQCPTRAQAGQLGEHLVHVLAQLGIGGQQSEIGVQPRRAGMVVAGAQVGVAAQTPFFAAQHDRHLGVRLVRHHAVDDMRPHLFEL